MAYIQTNFLISSSITSSVCHKLWHFPNIPHNSYIKDFVPAVSSIQNVLSTFIIHLFSNPSLQHSIKFYTLGKTSVTPDSPSQKLFSVLFEYTWLVLMPLFNIYPNLPCDNVLYSCFSHQIIIFLHKNTGLLMLVSCCIAQYLY